MGRFKEKAVACICAKYSFFWFVAIFYKILYVILIFANRYKSCLFYQIYICENCKLNCSSSVKVIFIH